MPGGKNGKDNKDISPLTLEGIVRTNKIKSKSIRTPMPSRKMQIKKEIIPGQTGSDHSNPIPATSSIN